MELVAARPEGVAEHRDLQRPGEWQRRRRARSAQRDERRGPCDAVDVQAGPDLEAAQRAFRARAEDAVEDSGREAVPRELELQSSNVPAFDTAAERPRAEGMPSETTERTPGLRARNAVQGDLRASLQHADGLRRPRARDPVDDAVVEPVRAQADLQRRDSGAADAARRCGEEERSNNNQQKSAPLRGA